MPFIPRSYKLQQVSLKCGPPEFTGHADDNWFAGNNKFQENLFANQDAMHHIDTIDHSAANRLFMLVWIYILAILFFAGILRIWQVPPVILPIFCLRESQSRRLRVVAANATNFSCFRDSKQQYNTENKELFENLIQDESENHYINLFI